MKSFIYLSVALGSLLTLSACSEDKGNYTYSPVDEMTVTFPDDIKALYGADDIMFTPTVVSKLEGEIKADNPNYTFGCKLNYRHYNDDGDSEMWYDINPEGTMTVTHPADIPAGNYVMWYTVTNKTTGVTFNFRGTVEILSTTYEGWMVLSNNGADKSARLDIIFKDPSGKSRCSYNLLGADAPAITEATQLGFYPSLYSTGDQIYLFSKSGSYALDANSLTTTSAKNIKNTEFIMPAGVAGEPTVFGCVVATGYSPMGRLIITSEGDVYKINTTNAGACYENLINNTEWGGDAAYKVAPFIGLSQARNSYQALLYDDTNKRFLRWNSYGQYYETALNTDKTLYPEPDPADKLFSYSTGMDLVHMEGTRGSNGIVYSVLQDNSGQRHVYGINIAGYMGGMTQVSAEDNISAEHFNDAEQYAFHSQLPVILYSYGNKLYCYNTTSHSVTDMVTLDAGEKITKLKFNLYQNMSLTSLNDQSEAFMDKQFNLVVATGNGQADGGKVRFYSIDANSNKLNLLEEYSGFGEEIVDVLYRERR